MARCMRLIFKSLVALCLMCQAAEAACITPQQAKASVLKRYAGAKFITINDNSLSDKLALASKITGQSSFKDSDVLYVVTLSPDSAQYGIGGFKNGCYITAAFVKKSDFPI